MSLTVGSRIVAKVSIARAYLQPSLGGFELAFSVEGDSTTDEASIFWLAAHSAHVKVGAQQGDLSRIGTARPASPVRIRTYKTAVPVVSEFRIPLSPSQLAAIEDLRAGGDLRFELGISGEGGNESRPGEILPFHDVLWLALGRSDWIQELRSARAMDTLLLEIPMPLVDASKQHGVVLDTLRQAQSLFLEGHYSDCVINCRKTIEGLASLQGRGRNWSSDALRRLANVRDTMSKDEREVALEASLFHFASLAAHEGGVEFDRRDAKLAITLAASVVAHSVS